MWTAKAPLPLTTQNHGLTRASDGRLIVVGGHNGNSTVIHNEVNAYDPVTGLWVSLPPLALARSDLAAVEGLDGRLFALGGFTAGAGARAEVETYRVGTATWQPGPPLTITRDGCAAAIGPDGRLYVVGGRNATPHVEVEAYGPHLVLAALSGAAGDEILISGDAFGAAAEVRIAFDGVPTAYATSSSNGVFSTTLTVPDVAPGTYAVRAIDTRTQWPVTRMFLVQ